MGRVGEEGDVEGPEGRREADVDVYKGGECGEGDSQAQCESAVVEGGDQGEGADGQQQRHSSQWFQ